MKKRSPMPSADLARLKMGTFCGPVSVNTTVNGLLQPQDRVSLGYVAMNHHSSKANILKLDCYQIHSRDQITKIQTMQQREIYDAHDNKEETQSCYSQ